jgi:hypothetical protein
MPGHLLTIELSVAGDEVTIHGDPAGLRILATRLATLAARAQTGGQSRDQLTTSVWGGDELSLQAQGANTRLLHHLKIIVWPNEKK